MSIGPLEITIIVLVVLLLFGGKKLPELARSLGRSMRIMKSEVKELQKDDAPIENQPAIESNPYQAQQSFQQGQLGDQPQQYGNPAQNNGQQGSQQ